MCNLSQETIQQSITALKNLLTETRDTRRIASFYIPPLREASNAAVTYQLQQARYAREEAACEKAIAELEKALERTS